VDRGLHVAAVDGVADSALADVPLEPREGRRLTVAALPPPLVGPPLLHLAQPGPAVLRLALELGRTLLRLPEGSLHLGQQAPLVPHAARHVALPPLQRLHPRGVHVVARLGPDPALRRLFPERPQDAKALPDSREPAAAAGGSERIEDVGGAACVEHGQVEGA
ncbi:hypothetical protein THAOC_21678, partial [Thalassiosira oceanica]